MHFYYFFLLLLVVLSAYSESPHHAKPPDFLDPIGVTVCPNSSSAQLGVFAPVLPQNEVYRIVLPQNGFFKIDLPQVEVNRTFLFQSVMFKIDAVNCHLSDRVKTIINFTLNLGVKSFDLATSILIHGGEKLAWTIRILLESLQHVLKMYTWSLSENQASVQFRCRLLGLLLKQSLFRTHDFDVLVYKLYHNHQNACIWNLYFFPKYKNGSHAHIREEHTKKSTRYQFHGGGKALLFSSDELLSYSSTDLHEQQYQFLHGVKKNQKQSFVLNDGDVLCNVPLNILAPKLTLKTAKELANLHDMYMPSKILLKNAQILLEDHKCEACDELLALFTPY